jgi:hypothetical protein
MTDQPPKTDAQARLRRQRRDFNKTARLYNRRLQAHLEELADLIDAAPTAPVPPEFLRGLVHRLDTLEAHHLPQQLVNLTARLDAITDLLFRKESGLIDTVHALTQRRRRRPPDDPRRTAEDEAAVRELVETDDVAATAEAVRKGNLAEGITIPRKRKAPK